MNQTVIDAFVETCKANGNKTAFIYRGRRISFETLLQDMFRMVNLIKSHGLMPGDKVLILVPPSYGFYVLMLAGIYYGINLVAMDSYKDIRRIKNVLESNSIGYVFCNGLTGFLKPVFGGDVKFINVAKYPAFDAAAHPYAPDLRRTVLTTFTSGTTGVPKPIYRNMADLREQIHVVSENIAVDNCDVVFSRLPIYSLFIVFKGCTCMVARKIRKKQLEKYGVTAVLVPIADLLALNTDLPFVKKASVGGAMLYPRQVDKILAVFPNAEVSYIYGSSECVLMAKADLSQFRNTFALSTDISGVELSIVNADSNGVGQLCAKGNVVLTDAKLQVSNDLGYIDELGLHIVGRKAFSAAGQYNYLTDMEILADNRHVKKGFSLIYKEKVYFCYEGTLSQKRDQVTYVRFRKLPMDAKHKTKLDYNKALSVIKRKYEKIP